MHEIPDEQLVESFRQSGAMRHLEDLVGRHIGRVRAMIYPMVLNDADADDLSQEVVEVVPNRKAGNRLALWVYPLADGKIAVDTSLSLDMPVRISSKTTAVVRQGQPSEFMSVRIGETEYRVFQTVETLGKAAQG